MSVQPVGGEELLREQPPADEPGRLDEATPKLLSAEESRTAGIVGRALARLEQAPAETPDRAPDAARTLVAPPPSPLDVSKEQHLRLLFKVAVDGPESDWWPIMDELLEHADADGPDAVLAVTMWISEQLAQSEERRAAKLWAHGDADQRGRARRILRTVAWQRFRFHRLAVTHARTAPVRVPARVREHRSRRRSVRGRARSPGRPEPERPDIGGPGLARLGERRGVPERRTA